MSYYLYIFLGLFIFIIFHYLAMYGDKKLASFKLTEQFYEKLKGNMPEFLISDLKNNLKNGSYTGETNFEDAIIATIGTVKTKEFKSVIFESAKITMEFKKTIASPMKFFYLIFFLSLAYKLITTGLLPNEEKIIESLNRTLLNQDPSSLFVFWVYRSICVVVGLQLIRIYITMELLEDPFLKHHNKYIRLLGTKKRFFEQLIRIFIIVIVSLKIFTEKDDWSNINTLASFLLSLYFGLLLLDCITLPPLKEWKNKKWSELIWPYMTIDFFGFGLAVLLYLMTSSSQNQTAYFIPIIVVLVVFLFLLFASLIHSIIKYFKEYCYFILDLLLNLYEPYYGGENKK